MEEALTALRAVGIPAADIAWISADRASVGRPDWRHGRGETQAGSEPQCKAANSLLDRGWDKPREPIEPWPAGADLSTFTDEELERIMRLTEPPKREAVP
jgi:hypothetical protein